MIVERNGSFRSSFALSLSVVIHIIIHIFSDITMVIIMIANETLWNIFMLQYSTNNLNIPHDLKNTKLNVTSSLFILLFL